MDEEEYRKSIECKFDGNIGIPLFEEIIARTKRKFKRIDSLYHDGAVVYGTVISQSRLSKWSFSIDFNDYGVITGNYKLHNQNPDSSIAKITADEIKKEILYYIGESQNEDKSKEHKSGVKAPKRKNRDNYINSQIKQDLLRFIMFMIAVLFVVALFAIGNIYHNKEIQSHIDNDEVKVPFSSDNIDDMTFEDANTALISAGFRNIELINNEDLIVGFINKEGEIIDISINGMKKFYSGTWYDADSIIQITYHGFKDDA